jgi:hypothetical protein
MIEKNYNILPKMDGQSVNFVTNFSSKIYKNNVLVSDIPVGDFSRYIDTIQNGFYMKDGKCLFEGVAFFIEDGYTIVTSSLGDSLLLDSNNKTRVSITPSSSYNTITSVLELNDYTNYLFFIWNDKWDILYKTDVSTPGQVWSGILPDGYYVLYIDTISPPITTITYGDGESDIYIESFIVFRGGGNTAISFSGSGIKTIYLRSLDENEMVVATTYNGIYIYSKKTKLGPFKIPFNTHCVLDFEYFINSGNTDIYVYCNYFLVGNGTLVDFTISEKKQVAFNMTSVNVATTLVSAKIYNLGLFVSSKPCPASVYDMCSRSISSPVAHTNVYDDDNIYIYKTDYSIWVLDYYNDTLMVLYGDELKRSTITSLYNNHLYNHDNYTTTSYGFSLDRYKIVDYLYNNGVFILLLEDRLVVIDKFGTVLRYIYCNNISKLFYIDSYVLFYDKTRARLYRVYSSDFRNFEFPSVLFDVDFGTKFKVCQSGGPFSVVDNDHVSVVKEQSVFGYKSLYDYSSIRTYTVGSSTFSNLVFEYDITQQATRFTGITTSLGYRMFANNPLESGLTSFTLFVSIKPMSLKFKRYLVRIPDVLDVYMVDGVLNVDIRCVNADVSVECTKLFNINVWYDIYITYHSSTGLYIYVGGYGCGKKEFDYDTGGTFGKKYIIIGGYGADVYSAYKFDGFIRDNVFISRSFITEAKAFDLGSNNIRNPKIFSKYNTYTDAYGVTCVEYSNGYMFVGTYDGLHIYETSTFDLVKTVGLGNIVLGIELKGVTLSVNLVKIPPTGEISGSSDDVIKISGELNGKLFMSGNKACHACVYNGNTYVKALATIIYVVDVSDYIGTDTLHGYYNLGKFSIDSLNTEIQCVSEFGYDEQNDIVIGDDYTNTTYDAKLLNCCGDEWGGVTAYVDSYTSAILYEAPTTRPKYDVFVDIKYLNESLMSINLFDLGIDINYTGTLYTFIISCLGGIRMPYENVTTSIPEGLAGYLSIDPCRLYHSENSLVGTSRVKFYFEVSETNLKLLKERALKVLENYIETSARFAYDFRGGMGNGVKHQIEDNTYFGTFDGTSYFLNTGFEDAPVWEFTAEFILRIDSYHDFNPIFSKATKSVLSYSMAICDGTLKFLFGQGGVISIIDLELPVIKNKWAFISIYVSHTYIDVFVNGIYRRILFYGTPDVVESGLYVGFGLYLNSRSANFIGDMLYFDINKTGTTTSINSDYSIYSSSKSESVLYDEILNLDEYYDLDDNVFRMTSAFWSDPANPIPRLFRLYGLHVIGYNDIKTISSIDISNVFSSSLLRRGATVNTNTLSYSLKSFSDCSDLSYDNIGGLYSVTGANTIEYSLDAAESIDKFDSVTTIKYTDCFTLLGTFGGLVKINNILSNYSTKQRWLFDNGVSALLMTDEYVYIAYGNKLGFVQTEYLKKTEEEVIIRNITPIYTSDYLIKSIVNYNDKTCILSGDKIINVTDNVEVLGCENARMLFEYDNDILIVYKNNIRKLSNNKVILEVSGKITDISYGDVLAVSTSSGFYLLDNTNNFIFNSIGVAGVLKSCEPLSDYCYHVCVNGSSLIYVYREINGIKLVEFNIDTKRVINSIILSALVDGGFSDYIPYTFDSVGR